jgi:hypothetical protein
VTSALEERQFWELVASGSIELPDVLDLRDHLLLSQLTLQYLFLQASTFRDILSEDLLDDHSNLYMTIIDHFLLAGGRVYDMGVGLENPEVREDGTTADTPRAKRLLWQSGLG